MTTPSMVDLERHVVLILGCAVHPGGVPSPALRRRVQLALETARGKAQVRFMPVGGQGRFGPAEAEVMRRLLVEAGVNDAEISAVPEGDNTIRSLRASWPVLCRELAGGGAVYVCSDAYHVPRCRLILRVWGLRTRPGARGGPAPGFRRALMRARELPAIGKDLILALVWRASGRVPSLRD